jgi:Rieske Fe-S protein
MAGARGVGSRVVIDRRAFLSSGLVLAMVGWSRRLLAGTPQSGGSLRYHRLARPVLVSRADLATPWRARSFVADAVTLPGAAKPNESIRISGLIVRTAAGDELEHFRAICARCPHEHCDVDFMPDPNKLPPEVIHEMGGASKQPVYICPCHNSTFKADDGERISGPAPRGLYRFRVTAVTDTSVEIAEVEEDMLIFA